MNYRQFDFKEAITLFSQSFIIVLFSFILIRLIEFSWFQFSLHQDVPWKLLLSKSINLDIIYLGFISIIGCILFLILRVINHTISLIFNVTWAVLLILIQISLTHFHLTNQTLLSSIVFQFSIQDLVNIIGAEFVQSKLLIFAIWLVVLLVTTFLLIKVNRKKSNKKLPYILFFLLISNSLLNINYAYKPMHKFTSVRDFSFSNSKPLFLYESYNSTQANPLLTYNAIKKDLKLYQNSNKKKEYIDIEYPLIYRNNSENVLGSFFKKTDTPPDIVLIISESLSSSYSVSATGLNGESITPFTDSLAANGLYWPNFFSNSYRSFGSLPNILSSLPPSQEERGFINMKNENGKTNYPIHQSIVSLLNNNNYYTSHFYPGWSGFDNTKPYMLSLGIDHLVEKSDFDTTSYSRYGRWGYSDYELYRKGLDDLDHINEDQPKLSIFQTIACHSPFDMVAPKYYSEDYLKSKTERLKLKSNNKQLSKFNPKQLSTIFASDEALKYLFNRIKSSDSFDNTIFIITGDHSPGVKLSNHILYKYHVPLIIYSPLLTHSKTFNGICSHIDIAPSLLALLNKNYNIKLNENAHWLGQGLDTSTVYASNNSFPLQLNGIIRPNYIHKNHIIFADKIYRLESDLKITLEENEDSCLQVKQNFEVFKTLNQYTTASNKIWDPKFKDLPTY